MIRFAFLCLATFGAWFTFSWAMGFPHWVDLIAVFVIAFATAMYDQATNAPR